MVQGLVRAVGVSNYGPKQLLKIHDYLTARGVPLCSAQVAVHAWFVMLLAYIFEVVSITTKA